MAGRKTMLTDTIQSLIIEAVLKGNYIKTACIYAGISEPTYYNWKNKAEKENDSRYVEFFKSVEQAEAAAEIKMAEKWQKIIDSEPNSHAAIKEFMERRYSERWGKKERHQVEDITDRSAQIEKVMKIAETFRKQQNDK